jgi:two-component system response regulator DegU
MLLRRVLVVHEQPLYRLGVRRVLEVAGGFKVVGEAGCGYEAIQQVDRHRPDLLLIDAHLPGLTGFGVSAAILQQDCRRVAVIFAPTADEPTMSLARLAGASSVLPYHSRPDQLVDSLHATIIQRSFRALHAKPEFRFAWPLPRRSGRGEVAAPAITPSSSELSRREIEVLDCVAQGFSNREIADALYVTEQTVKNHLTSIFRKLAVDDRVQALLAAIRRGWVDFRPALS